MSKMAHILQGHFLSGCCWFPRGLQENERPWATIPLSLCCHHSQDVAVAKQVRWPSPGSDGRGLTKCVTSRRALGAMKLSSPAQSPCSLSLDPQRLISS